MGRWRKSGAGPAFAVFGLALVLGCLSAFAVVRGARREGRPGAAVDRLALAATLERSRTVGLGNLGERGTALAVHRWSRMGLDVQPVGTRTSAVEVRVLPVEDPAVSAHWQAAGMRVEGHLWVHGCGLRVPAAGAAAAITVVQGHGLATYVVTKGGVDVSADEAIERLTRSLPPTRPGLTLWSEGRRRLDMPLTLGGQAILPKARIQPIHRTVAARAPGEAELTRARELRQRLASIGLDAPQVARLVPLAGVGDRALDGPVRRAGWYDARRRELHYLAGVTGALDDALLDFAETALLDAYGAPGEAWLLGGVAHSLVGSAQGLRLDGAELATVSVSFGEAVGASPRATAPLAGARARLARRLHEACGGDWARAFAAEMDGDLRESLREAWAADEPGDEPGTQGSPQRRPSRTLPSGVAVRISGSPAEARARLGTASFRAELERLRSLGFDSIVLEVQVPVAPPRADERTARPLALEGWGSSVTLEGDGAVLAALEHARAAGLGVTLWPRVVASASGPLAGLQIHGGPEQYAVYGERLAVALEGCAWLAERAGVDALAVLAPEDMPLARELVSDVASEARRQGYPELLAVRAGIRSGVVVRSGRFRGQLLGATGGLAGWEYTVAQAGAEPDSIFREGRVGVLSTLQVAGRASARSLRQSFDRFRAAGDGLELAAMCVRLEDPESLPALGQCIAEGDWPETVIVERWDVGPGRGRGSELSSLGADVLRRLTARQ